MSFIKNDNSFICINCNKNVNKLKYTSRDHCNYCLYGLHVDIDPGDRLNDCKGILIPINILNDSKKEKVIEYRCSKCSKVIRNKVASDDDIDEIYKIIEKYSKQNI